MITRNQIDQWTLVDPNSYLVPGVVYRAYYSVKKIPLLPTRVQQIIIQTQMKFRKKFPGIKVLKWQFEGDFFVVEFVQDQTVTQAGLITLAVIVIAISATIITASLTTYLLFKGLFELKPEIIEEFIEGAKQTSRNAMLGSAFIATATPISLYLLRGVLFKK